MQRSVNLEVEYVGFENSDLRRQVERAIEKYQWIIPPDITRIKVVASEREDGDDSTHSAETTTNSNYGYAQIVIRDGQWNGTDKDFEETITHELLHVAQGPLIRLVHRRLLQYIKEHNENLGAFAEDEFSDRLESYTERLATAIVATLAPYIA